MKNVDVIIIGAGAAGLMCAITAGQRGRRVLVLDHSNKPGKKILMSGGGRCNFTNTNTSHEAFISNNPHFCKSALNRYTADDFIELVERHRIPFHEKTLGQLFCDHSSKDILNMLLSEANDADVTIQLHTDIQDIKKNPDNHFMIDTSKGNVSCQSLVIATGGLSIPTMGATPFGYRIAKQFGMHVHPTRAGLVPFTLHDKDKTILSSLSGVSMACQATVNNTSFNENLLFTHRGLSGPAMLQISSYWEPGQTLHINLSPYDDLTDLLLNAKHNTPNRTMKGELTQHFPKRVVDSFVEANTLHKPLMSLTDETIRLQAARLSDWQLVPNNTEGYRTAEVTLGGVDCNAISSKTFETNQTPGLYFIGEVLDVTGWLGGYNFQWAWSSGYAAGVHV